MQILLSCQSKIKINTAKQSVARNTGNLASSSIVFCFSFIEVNQVHRMKLQLSYKQETKLCRIPLALCMFFFFHFIFVSFKNFQKQKASLVSIILVKLLQVPTMNKNQSEY